MQKSRLFFKSLLALIYFAGAICLWEVVRNLKDIPYASMILPVYLLVAGIVVVVLLRYPYGKAGIEMGLRSIGFVNYVGEVPELVRKYYSSNSPQITIYEFENPGIPIATWVAKQQAIEAGINKTILKMKYHRGKRRVQVYTVSAQTDMPTTLNWNDKYLSDGDFTLVLGEGLLGAVTVNLEQVPHILVGGETGSGKSYLLKLMLMQALRKGAAVYIADFKGGVDFPLVWHEKCRMCFEEGELLIFLTDIVNELEYRKTLLQKAECQNIVEYGTVTGDNVRRIILACDEVAEVLDKTGCSKEQKEMLSQIESKLSLIARQGRAFGIHLILATQRPDANLIPGQIRTNLGCRICGRADKILAQIILDNTAAAEQVPKDARGRFVLNDGTLFQAYMFDERFI